MTTFSHLESKVISEILAVPLDIQKDQSRGVGAWTKRIFKRVVLVLAILDNH